MVSNYWPHRLTLVHWCEKSANPVVKNHFLEPINFGSNSNWPVINFENLFKALGKTFLVSSSIKWV